MRFAATCRIRNAIQFLQPHLHKAMASPCSPAKPSLKLLLCVCIYVCVYVCMHACMNAVLETLSEMEASWVLKRINDDWISWMLN